MVQKRRIYPFILLLFQCLFSTPLLGFNGWIKTQNGTLARADSISFDGTFFTGTVYGQVLHFPLENVVEIQFNEDFETFSFEADAAGDQLFPRATREGISGVLKSIKDDSLVFAVSDLDDQEKSINLDKVFAVRVSRNTVDKSEETRFLVKTSRGQIFRADTATLDESTQKYALISAEWGQIAIPKEEIMTLISLDENTIPLVSLSPELISVFFEDEALNSEQLLYAVLKPLAFTDGFDQIISEQSFPDDKPILSALQMQSDTKIDYKVRDEFKRFSGLVKKDEFALKEAKVLIKIFGDDVLLWESELNEKTTHTVYDLELKKISLLRIEVLNAGDTNFGDKIYFINPLLEKQ